MNFRLIRQQTGNYYGGDRICTYVWYVLQTRYDEEHPWETVPVVMWEELSDDEKAEIIRKLEPSQAIDRLRG